MSLRMDPPSRATRRGFLARLAGTAVLAGRPVRAPAAPAAPLVAAAADLRYAFPEVAAASVAAGGVAPRVSYGSSGNFFRQIRQGAPFDLFLSADEAYVLDLARAGRTLGHGALYALGRLALLVPARSPLRPDGSLDDLAAALGDGRLRRLAIANPAHAPYGRAAREALEHRGLWGPIEARLVLGENAAQATQFALSAAADGGLVPYALALAPAVAARARHALVPGAYHAPLRQRMALVRGAGPAARALYDFVRGPTARAILDRFGFTLPPASANG